jgi:predicted dehydrogenase
VRVRWGIAGTGAIAAAFAATIREMPGAVVAAASSDDPGRAAAFAADHGIPVGLAPHEALARVAGLDAVYVATTNDRHEGASVACLDAGIPVLCEKPIAMSSAQARRMVVAALRTGTFLMEAWWSLLRPARRGAVGAGRLRLPRPGVARGTPLGAGEGGRGVAGCRRLPAQPRSCPARHA